jgi:hypothetical protein
MAAEEVANAREFAVNWRRIVYCIPWTTAILLAFAMGVQSLVVWYWVDRQLPSLQQYYLWAYLISAETAKHPGASTRIEWLLKTAPGGKRELASEGDVIDARSGRLHVQLSPDAIDQGWTGIEKSLPQQIVSANLSETLKEDFYDGAGVGRVMFIPILTACVLLIMLIWVSFSSRQELAAEWSRVLREIMGPQPARRAWRLLADSRGKAWLIRLLTDLRKEIDSAWMRRSIDARSVGLTEANRPGIAAVIGGEQLPSRPAEDTRSAGISSADPSGITTAIAGEQLSFPSVQQTDSVPDPPAIRPANKSPRRRFIFPGRAGIRGSAQSPKPWDGSDWID